jgi:phosphonate transport system permease protein
MLVRAPTADRRGLSDLAMREASRPARWSGRSGARRFVAAGALAVTVAALLTAGVGRTEVFRTEGVGLIGDFFTAAVSPRLDGTFLALTAVATVTTLAYAVLGTAISLVIGFVGGVLTSETWWRSGRRRRGATLVGWAIARIALAVPRGIHEIVWGLFLLSIFGIHPIVAVLAIGIPFGAVTAKVFSELLDETSRQPYNALIAAGVSRPAALTYGLLPQALADLFSYSFYRFECAIRSAAILGLIGAGGLGFQLQLSFQALAYNEIWTLLYALIALCAAADFWSSTVRSRRTAVRVSASGRRPRWDRVLLGSAAATAALLPLSAWWIGLDLSVLWDPHTWQLTEQIVAKSWPPRLPAGGVGELLSLVGITLAMSVVAIVLAFIGGSLLAFPASRHQSLAGTASGSHAARIARMLVVVVTRAILIALRAIPPPIWALLLLFVFYPGLLPGALALGIYTIGVLGRLMAETTENLDARPLHALRANGAPTMHVFCYGVIPAAAPRFVAYGLYRWEVTIRDTVVVGVVGAGGLGLLLHQQLAAFDYSGALATLLTLVALTLVVDIVSAMVRRILR